MLEAEFLCCQFGVALFDYHLCATTVKTGDFSCCFYALVEAKRSIADYFSS